jgi:hypothetical protein
LNRRKGQARHLRQLALVDAEQGPRGPQLRSGNDV